MMMVQEDFFMAICHGCNKEIVWAQTKDGVRIPLDPRAPVYRLLGDSRDPAPVIRDKTAMVSHFATCPNANEFSGKKK